MVGSIFSRKNSAELAKNSGELAKKWSFGNTPLTIADLTDQKAYEREKEKAKRESRLEAKQLQRTVELEHIKNDPGRMERKAKRETAKLARDKKGGRKYKKRKTRKNTFRKSFAKRRSKYGR